MATPESFSLFEDLTKLKQKSYPVTEVIKFLVETIGHDVCSTKRNIQSSYWLVSRARDLCDKINELIAKVELDKEGTEWNSFDEYTSMIDPLEDILFKFALTALSESQEEHLPGGQNLEDCLESIARWKTNRSDLHVALESLYSETFKAPVNSFDTSATRKQDDIAILLPLYQKVEHHQFKNTPSRIKKTIAEVIKQLSTIQWHILKDWGNNQPSDDTVAIAIQCSMLIGNLLDLAAKLPRSEAGSHIRSPDVWLKAHELLSTVTEHFKSPTLPSEQLETAWTTFLKLLKKHVSKAGPDSTVFALKSHVGQVTGAYYLQTLFLVNGCRQLIGKAGDRSPAIAENIETAVKHTTDAFIRAKSELPDITSLKSSAQVDAAFATAAQSIKDCFDAFQLDGGSWHKKFEGEKTKDNKRLDKLRLETSRDRTGDSKDKVFVKVLIEVTIREKPGTNQLNIQLPGTATYNVELTTPIAALQYKEAIRSPDLCSRIQAFDTEIHNVNGERISPETEIDKIPLEGRNRYVRLVIGA